MQPGKLEEMERIPAITGLNQFAEKLQPEHRGELYRIAEAFLNIGAMHGVFATLGGTSKGDKQEEYIAYFQTKAAESRSAQLSGKPVS